MSKEEILAKYPKAFSVKQISGRWRIRLHDAEGLIVERWEDTSDTSRSVRIPLRAYRRMKIEAAKRGVFISKIINEALMLYFASQKVKP